MAVLQSIRDGLQNLITGLGTRADASRGRMYCPTYLDQGMIDGAYRGSGMLRKVINIPALDATREWRDWQADADQIEALEAEEKRLGLQSKVRQAEILRGLGGGALILGVPGEPAMPAIPRSIGKGGLAFVHVVSRYHLSLGDMVEDPMDPLYGGPKWFEMSASGGMVRLHPSRVVAFRGDPLPRLVGRDWQEEYWGEGRVPAVLAACLNLDEALASFAALIKDARNIDVGVPQLLERLSTPEGEALITKRVALMAQGSSIVNANLYDAGGEEGKGGEKIDRHQVTWTGIPEVIRVNAEALAAVADIPMTRLWGKAAEGMNASGDSQQRDWNKMVVARQTLDLQPCMDQVDAFLIPSALGTRPAEIWAKWSPLDTPTEQQEADRFDKVMTAIGKVADTATIPSKAFAKATQNTLIENGWMPGLEAALDEIPEDERYGLEPEPGADEEDPSALQAEGGDQTAGGSGPYSRAPKQTADAWFADASPRPLYVQRKLLNADDVIAWAKANGFESTLPADDMHVTVLYSRSPVDPMKMGRDWREDDKGQMLVRPGGPRVIERLGENAVVLRFASPDLEYRHRDMIEAGGSHDWEEYQPHVTLSYAVPAGVDLDALKPFNGVLRFGPEIFEPLDLDWKSKVTEE